MQQAMSSQAGTSSLSKGEATRQRIVVRALELAGQVGLEGLTIGELASDMGLSKSGLFAHFKSKERLQLAVLDAAAQHFVQRVFMPAMKQPRGEPRLRAIFENWLEWIRSQELPGGCIFLAGAMEWDDREGAVRDQLVSWFEQLYAGMRKAISLCVEEGHFRDDIDIDQLTSELHGIALKYHLDNRLLRNRRASERARKAYDRLIDAARA
jgi:AcrR family transcriptional regulator